ncbi:MAG: PorP/SprF family type IX secretion system membrane protein [Bacteroidia bacterium]
MKPYFQYRKKIKLVILSIVGSLVLLQPLVAQDFQLSQYDAPPLFLNPAMTGLFNGQYRIHAHYRNQWRSISSKPFTTTGISFDMPIKKFGLGVQVMNYQAGSGNYNVFNILFSSAYDLSIDADENHHLSFGAQIGFTQKNIDVNKLTYGNQFSSKNGGDFDISLPSGELYNNVQFSIFNLNAGVLYYYAKNNKFLNPFIGLSVFNINQPTETFYQTQNKLSARFYLHGGTKINISEKIQLLPKFIYMKQLSAEQISVSILMHYFMKTADTYLIFGPTYRNKDAAIIEAGINKGAYIVRVSYDVTISSLKKVTQSRGGFELSATYTIRKAKPNNSFTNLTCPRL